MAHRFQNEPTAAVNLGYAWQVMGDPNRGVRGGCLKLVGEWDFFRHNELEVVLQSAESLDDVSLDLSEMTFLDASVLGSLVRLRNRVLERSSVGRVRIVAASQAATFLLTLCDLRTSFALQEAMTSPGVGRNLRLGWTIRGTAPN